MKIMKTKIKTLIAICALGIIGLININAISDNKKVVVNDKTEMLAIESGMTDEAFVYSAQAFSTADMNNEIESYTATNELTKENTMSDEAAIYSARTFADTDINNEIEEYATNQILPEENSMTNEVIYSAKAFAAIDFENEIKNMQ